MGTELRIFLAAVTAALLLVGPGGCGSGSPDDGFGGGDDDDDDDDTGGGSDIGCPNDWRGFGDDPDPDSWDMLVLYAIGDENFDIGERDLGGYGTQVVKYDAGANVYELDSSPGLCFRNGGGLFRGNDEYYGGDFYSVSLELDEDDGFGGHIQVLPTDGTDPHLLGEPGTLRGLAIVPDDVGGFVVCGSTSAGGANAILWVDEAGEDIVEFPLPAGGSCYDVAQAWDGRFWVTDTATATLFNFDLELGTFHAHVELPEAGIDWVVDEGGNGAVMVGADNEIYVVGAETGNMEWAEVLSDLGITINHVTNFHWSHGWGVMSLSSVMRDYPASPYYGPHSARVEGGPDPGGNTFYYGGEEIHDGQVNLDYVLLGDLQ